MTTLRPFFTYFGGKWRAAPHYPAPQHNWIIEPFAGAAGYSLRYPDKNVDLVDLDEKVAGTWDYIIKTPESEIRALPLYDGTWETTDDLDLPQEARWLIGWWLNKATVQPSKSPSKWVREVTTTGENVWGAGVRERIASQQQYIRHWSSSCGSYLDIDTPHEYTWFIDPPYQVRGSSYKHSDIDYAQLAEWCRGLKGQVIVCENEGATWLPFEPFRDTKATHGSRRTGVSREVVWLNNGEL